MARRKPKSVKVVSDHTRPWSERIEAARRAVGQMPPDWKRDTLAAFLDEVEGQLAPDAVLAAALE